MRERLLELQIVPVQWRVLEHDLQRKIGMLKLGWFRVGSRGESDDGIHDKQRVQTSCFCQVRRT